jgi:hypothetical protein
MRCDGGASVLHVLHSTGASEWVAVPPSSKAAPANEDIPSSPDVFVSTVGGRVGFRTSFWITYSAGGDSGGEVGDDGAAFAEVVVKAVFAWLTSSSDGIGMKLV